jgi:predicted house-cleaning NTP pyrophosphatase (Maf/HAM1 superfamily)
VWHNEKFWVKPKNKQDAIDILKSLSQRMKLSLQFVLQPEVARTQQ